MKVTANVYVMKDGFPVLLRPGDTVPDGVTVTNPAVIDADSAAADKEAAEKETADKAAAEKAPAKRTAKAAPASE